MSMPVLQQATELVRKSSFVRFLISGGINTVATYAVYIALLQVTSYKVAYTVAYVFGIFIAFFINRLFVFQTHRGWGSLLMFPFVYLAQYLVSLAVVFAWVEHLKMSAALAPLIAIVVTIPLTFVLSRFVFGNGTLVKRS
ncbi:GtrA family protein [Xanthomonas campestris]|uniref:GtrA family protein n=1 Tax=Xanthomonas campestris TaxID=339 RepID=UPI001CD4FB86|nr:GtrA family protein [Xanthomonas campestris]